MNTGERQSIFSRLCVFSRSSRCCRITGCWTKDAALDQVSSEHCISISAVSSPLTTTPQTVPFHMHTKSSFHILSFCLPSCSLSFLCPIHATLNKASSHPLAFSPFSCLYCLTSQAGNQYIFAFTQIFFSPQHLSPSTSFYIQVFVSIPGTNCLLVSYHCCCHSIFLLQFHSSASVPFFCLKLMLMQNILRKSKVALELFSPDELPPNSFFFS